jgi:hypothetical protein
MKKITCCLSLVALGLCLTAASLSAADAKDYQVTGPVLEVTPTYIVVKKGEANWQIAVDKNTKGANVKVGDKVTIYYTMVATEVEVKPAKKAKSDAADKADKK